MSRSEKFGLFATFIGFIVDTAALLGFALGFIELSPSLGFLANPLVVAILTYTLTIFFIGALSYYLIQRAKVGWRQRTKLPKEHHYAGLEELGILLWIPTVLLWIIGTFRHFYSYFFGETSLGQAFEKADPGFTFFVTFFLVLMMPLFFLALDCHLWLGHWMIFLILKTNLSKKYYLLL